MTGRIPDRQKDRLVRDRSQENLPEGILKRGYSLDGIRLELRYSLKDHYYITSGLILITRCNSLHQAELIFQLLNLCEDAEFKKAIRIAKQLDRQYKELYSLLSKRQLKSEQDRINSIIRRVLDKLEKESQTSNKTESEF
jgi:hypothetical protein